MMCTPTQGVWQPAGCVYCELVCVCVSLVRVVIICPASTHTALVSSPSLTVLRLSINQARTMDNEDTGLLLVHPARHVCKVQKISEAKRDREADLGAPRELKGGWGPYCRGLKSVNTFLADPLLTVARTAPRGYVRLFLFEVKSRITAASALI